MRKVFKVEIIENKIDLVANLLLAFLAGKRHL